ncbi:hypothetical protein ECANGB1_2465 [Enterospora canceri]|uniref:Uncharacterized protein n=1 Tax=Enterospora canceri TaxID=1081671 RepID=A0A1Y1SAS4_9MICR|nr:hypothetical protein ECANGB1_2465 [Enterospora canceri]
MTPRSYSKYAKFIGDDEFVRNFIPGAGAESESSEPVEAYIFPTSPKYLVGELRPYQLEGLNWLVKMHEGGINGILADEMGLGKTVQSICLLGYIKFVKNENRKSLIVVPKSVLENWSNEFRRFVPGLKTRTFWCSRDSMAVEAKDVALKKYDAIITTYEMCLNARKWLRRVHFEYLIVDEGHRLKNENSLLAKTLRGFHFRRRLLLTGTPLQNNIHELWSLLNFILPELFADSEKFEELVKEAGQRESVEKIEKLRQVLSCFFLRREKHEVETALLPKKSTNIYCPMSAMQRDWYRAVLNRDLGGLIRGRSANKTGLLNILMQLRKVCNHPYLFEGAEADTECTGEDLVDASGKMRVLDTMLANLRSSGSRVLLFSQMSRVLDILEDYLVMRGYRYRRIDGNTEGSLRNKYIEEYNAPESEYFIFILTTRAGGLGINLYTADTVILYDSDWNPYADLQAQDRAHRIGQTRQVQVFRLVVENSIEENIVLRAQKKLKLDEVLLKKDGRRHGGALSQKEMMHLLATGLDAIENERNENQPLSFEEILKVGAEKTRLMEKQIEEFRIGAEENERVDMFNWDGEDQSRRRLDQFVAEAQVESGTKRMCVFKNTSFRPMNFPPYQFYPKEFFSIQEAEADFHGKGMPLSAELQQRKEGLLKEGFDWTKKDYKTFLAVLEAYGRDKLKVCKAMAYKNDVARYYDVFFDRIEELEDCDRILLLLSRTEERLGAVAQMKEIIEDLEPHEIEKRVSSKNRAYLDNATILRKYAKYADGPNPIENVRADLMADPMTNLDWILLTKSPHELQKHINALIQQLIRPNK